jgi:hypothetical protein
LNQTKNGAARAYATSELDRATTRNVQKRKNYHAMPKRTVRQKKSAAPCGGGLKLLFAK